MRSPVTTTTGATTAGTLFASLAVLLALTWTGPIAAQTSESNAATALRTSYTALGPQLAKNAFQRPLHLVSTETSNSIKGELYALVEHPFATVSAALSSPANWCDVMILHINTKYCRASADTRNVRLAVRVGAKHDQPLASAHQIDFAYRVVAQSPEFLQVQLGAESGPMGTTDYRIVLKGAAVEGDKTFLHFSYSYGYGFAGRVAMQAYLATAGRNKVGFTITGTRPNGQPEYIRDVRAVVERNTMRYYLAIEAFLSALAVPASEQFERRLRIWHAETEKFPRQLHEDDAVDYFAIKRKEYQRQQAQYAP